MYSCFSRRVVQPFYVYIHCILWRKKLSKFLDLRGYIIVHVHVHIQKQGVQKVSCLLWCHHIKVSVYQTVPLLLRVCNYRKLPHLGTQMFTYMYICMHVCGNYVLCVLFVVREEELAHQWGQEGSHGQPSNGRPGFIPKEKDVPNMDCMHNITPSHKQNSKHLNCVHMCTCL